MSLERDTCVIVLSLASAGDDRCISHYEAGTGIQIGLKTTVLFARRFDARIWDVVVGVHQAWTRSGRSDFTSHRYDDICICLTT